MKLLSERIVTSNIATFHAPLLAIHGKALLHRPILEYIKPIPLPCKLCILTHTPFCSSDAIQRLEKICCATGTVPNLPEPATAAHSSWQLPLHLPLLHQATHLGPPNSPALAGPAAGGGQQ